MEKEDMNPSSRKDLIHLWSIYLFLPFKELIRMLRDYFPRIPVRRPEDRVTPLAVILKDRPIIGEVKTLFKYVHIRTCLMFIILYRHIRSYSFLIRSIPHYVKVQGLLAYKFRYWLAKKCDCATERMDQKVNLQHCKLWFNHANLRLIWQAFTNSKSAPEVLPLLIKRNVPDSVLIPYVVMTVCDYGLRV